MKSVLVDADGLLYLAGYAVETTNYQLVYQDEAENMYIDWFPSVADILGFIQENPGYSEVERIPHKEVGPLSYALMIAKGKMREIRDRYGSLIEVYIRGDNQRNFRDQIATIAPYKGNRQDEKPTYFQEIREYLVDNWGAYKVDEHEVDDELGCRLTELENQGREAVIVSPDKDLDQLPGTHWSYKLGVEYEIEPYEGLLLFYQQALSGDTSDNIKGCWKIGEGRARSIIQAVADQPEDEIWNTVVEAYVNSLEHEKCPYKDRDPAEVALENAQLVYMRRQRGEIWMPPGIPNLREKVRPTLDG